MSDNEKLQPCPFCGNAAAPMLSQSERSQSYAVFCDASTIEGLGGCGASSGYKDTKQAAIEAWNRRASAKPLTRRDINVNNLSPGVRALHDAFIHHDMAEMTLYARDDQVAWTALGVAGKPRPVIIGHMREVLVAALGLPPGTKFGG